MSVISPLRINGPRIVLHWYDFLCPFCYIGQSRNKLLLQQGFEVVDLAFQAHPDIPRGGIAVKPRKGPMYAQLESEARESGLPLRWPTRLPNTREALAAAEWSRRYQPREFPALHSMLFQAHFALGEDIGDRAVIEKHASAAGIDVSALQAALVDGTAAGFVTESEELGQRYGVQGTPAWLLNNQLILGLRSAAEFELLAEEVVKAPR
jgi:predicted DsbA family dithiol-disulfide isomerase